MTDKKKRRADAITSLGGKCVKCGTDKHLQFDHIDPSLKEMNISKALASTNEILKRELAKYQLLCYGCHQIKTAQEAKYKNPNPSLHRGYLKGCRCGMYRVQRKEKSLKVKTKTRKSPRYILQRWYFWSKKYYRDNFTGVFK